MARQGDDYYLVLTDTGTEDSGLVTAAAANSSGEAKSHSKLAVESSGAQHPPEFKKLFYDHHVQPGDNLRLDAVILGSPKPRVKWLVNGEPPEQENCRCTMAGDTYSFVLDAFSEANCGRYSIVAENVHGKATCSAEVLFEGSEFSPVVAAASPLTSTSMYHEETVSTKTVGDVSETVKTSKQVTSNNGATATAESKSVETVPLSTRDLATQHGLPLPQLRDTGIQMARDLIDKSSQMAAAIMRDESSQWMENSLASALAGVGEAAPLVGGGGGGSTSYASSSLDKTENSYSYTRQTGSSTTTTLPHVDFSTTLIKDINQHHGLLGSYEPVELIFNQSAVGLSGSGGCLACGGCGGGCGGGSAFGSGHHLHQCCDHHRHHCHCHCGSHHHLHHMHMDEFNSSSSCRHQQQQSQMHHSSTNANARALYEPINLIIQKPCTSRSGSLPPLISKINFNSTSSSYAAGAAENAATCTDDEATTSSSYYYRDNKENTNTITSQQRGSSYYTQGASSMTRTSRPTSAFKPVELILDGADLMMSTLGKRYRDLSLPSGSNGANKRIRMPIKHTNMNESSFIYDNYNNQNNNNNSHIRSRSSSRNRMAATMAAAAGDSHFYGECCGARGGALLPSAAVCCSACICNCSCTCGCGSSGGDHELRFNSSDFLSGSAGLEQYHQYQQRSSNEQAAAAAAATTTYKFATVASSAEDSHRIRVDHQQQQQQTYRPVKFPTMEMTIDLKSPPVIERPLSHVTVTEGQNARLECVLNGMCARVHLQCCRN
jgi:hypothetical protein